MFVDRPIIGQGPKLFREKCSDKKFGEGMKPCDTHPHNFYIQILAETGIGGFLFLFGFFVFFLSKVIQNAYRIILKKTAILSYYQICLMSGLLITLWPVVPNGNFFNNYLMILYSLQIGFFKINEADNKN